MSKTTKYNFPVAKRGDTYSNVEFLVIVNDNPVNLTGASIRMWIVNSAKVMILELTTVNNKIVIVNPTGGVFRTEAGIVSIPKGQYNYDIEIKFSDNTVKTWIEGIFEVSDDITK